MGDRYEIRRKIGSGGVGAVYEATDTFLDRKVAIKRLLPADESESPELAKDSLEKETAALSALQHPNIVTIFDVGADEEGQFVVMELIEGENIEEAVEKETLSINSFSVFAAQTLDALASAQSLNLLHRDIKPRNLMIRWLPDGKPLAKILDFGLAKFAPKPALQTMDQNKAVLGSVFYMAPEQFERRPLDRRTDIYSLGCVYYYALSGHDPYSGSTGVEVMNAHLEHRVHHLTEFRPDLPGELADWVMWMINREPADRPENAGQAAAFLAALQNNGLAGATAPVEVKAEPAEVAPLNPATPTTRKLRVAQSDGATKGTKRPVLLGSTDSVVERDLTTGLVPDVEKGLLTRPPSSTTAATGANPATGASAAPAVPLKKATGASAAPAVPLMKATGASAAPAAPLKKATGASAAPAAPLKKATGASAAPAAPLKKATGTSAAPAAPLMRATGTTGATPVKKVTGSTGIAVVVPEGIQTGEPNRKLIWFGIGATGLALLTVGVVLIASLSEPTDKTPSYGVGIGSPQGGAEDIEVAPPGLPEWNGRGGGDLFSEKNWRGGKAPKRGGEGLVASDLTRSMQRVNGPLNLNVAGKLNVAGFYDVVGFRKKAGFLKVEPGGEVKVGSKLIIGRKTSGWVEVRGKLTVTSDLEIGDTKGTKARITVEGGEAIAPKCVSGDCEWKIEVKGRGKLNIRGEASFLKGLGTVRVTDGGLISAKKLDGLTRPEVVVTVERGGKIRLEGAGAENVLKGWVNAKKIRSSGALEVKKVNERGKISFEIISK